MKRKIQQSILVICILFAAGSYAQNDMLFLNMRDVPQVSAINPSFTNPELFNVGVPFLSSGAFGYGNSGFRFNKLLRKRSDDSLEINVNDFINVIGRNNYIGANASYEILGGGYNWQKWYFTFSWSDKLSMEMRFPQNLLEFVTEGNYPFIGQTLEFDNIKLKALHYREWAFGAARPINDRWTVGAKAKILFGKSSMYTENITGSFFTDPDTYHITTSNTINFNQSLPEVLQYDTLDFNYYQYSKGFKNPGFAMDLGATYKLDDKITIYASVLDLGWIRWKNNLKNYRSNDVTWTFKGIDINDYINEPDDVVEARLNSLQDSLTSQFGLEESETRFNTPLTPKIYIGASYVIDNQQTAGVVIRSTVFNGTIQPQINFSYLYKVNTHFTAAGSYSIAYRNVGNLGLGFIGNYGPMQFYLATDNFVGLVAPASVRYTNIRLGFNYLHRVGTKKSVTAPRI